VQRGIYAEFTDRFVAAAKALVAGDPKDEATQLGPLASEQHYRKVRSYLDGIEADGGTITTGGLGDGWVVLPTVVENAPPAARICREEVFGPVVTIAPFDDDEDAIRSANDTRYGLNAMVFTRDLSRAHRASAALRAGTVWANCSSSATCAPRSATSATPASAARATPSAASSSPSPRP
jgi:aminomuconate-semialdehyde/2-hydroxymuconate-6-semialdehyde dehydrogenase